MFAWWAQHKKSEERVNSEGVRERGRKFPAISHSPLEQDTLLGPDLSNEEGHELVLVVPLAYPLLLFPNTHYKKTTLKRLITLRTICKSELL